MIRHYTHTSEAAAGAAVASLPDITGQTRPALPAGDSGMIAKAKVRDLVERLTTENAAETRRDLFALLVTP
jgi:hypothetical protein